MKKRKGLSMRYQITSDSTCDLSPEQLEQYNIRLLPLYVSMDGKTLRDGVRARLACFDDLFPPERTAIHREMAKRGREVTADLLLTKYADNAAKTPDGPSLARQPWQEAQAVFDVLVAENACCSVHELALGGEALAALGYRGREIGAVLARLLDEVAAEKLENTREALERRAQRLWRSGFARHTIENKKH